MITGLPPPSKYDLDFLQRWLEHPDLGNSVFDGADSHVYNKPAGLGTLAWRGGEVDAMTGLLVTLLPNLYHWGVVHPFHRICGKWIKVLWYQRQNSQGARTDHCRNQKTIMIARHCRQENQRPPQKMIASHAKTSQPHHHPHQTIHQTTHQHSDLAQMEA